VRLAKKIQQARLVTIGQEPQDLKIYEGEDGGSEIDIPQVPFYGAVMIQ
jgi:hypothetical protein